MRPPILCVHGAFGQAANFEPWLGYFREAGYQASAISLPGHAPPDRDILKRATLADYSTAVAEAVARFDQPPIVVGHSMGGLLAMKCAAEAKCAGLVLVASPAPGRLPARLNVFHYALPVIPWVLLGLPISTSSDAVRSLVTHNLSAAESDEVIARGGIESGRVLRQTALRQFRVALEDIQCPVLCLGAGGDRLVPQLAAHQIAEATGAELVVFPGAGHWLIAGSLTGTVAATVRGWLDRHF